VGKYFSHANVALNLRTKRVVSIRLKLPGLECPISVAKIELTSKITFRKHPTEEMMCMACQRSDLQQKGTFVGTKHHRHDMTALFFQELF
jgi:hypothetical protein